MTVLDGDKIEKLLWENGYDFFHVVGIDGFSSFHVVVGDRTVCVSETWDTEDSWSLDTETLIFELFIDGELVDESYEMVPDEAALVDYIAEFGNG